MTRTRLTREESRRRTRELLLDVAADIFSRRGFHATSVEEVAEAAGFSKGAVYSNFDSKEDLFLALLDRHLTRAQHALERVLTPGRSRAGASADAQGQRFAEHLEEVRTWNVLTIEFWLFAMRDERAREKLAARYRLYRDELAARLRERFAAEGVTPPLPVEYLAWSLIGLGTGLALQAYLEPGALPPDIYRAVTGQLLGGAPADPGGAG